MLQPSSTPPNSSGSANRPYEQIPVSSIKREVAKHEWHLSNAWEAVVMDRADLGDGTVLFDVLDLLAKRGLKISLGKGALSAGDRTLRPEFGRQVFICQRSGNNGCGVWLRVVSQGNDLYLSRWVWYLASRPPSYALIRVIGWFLSVTVVISVIALLTNPNIPLGGLLCWFAMPGAGGLLLLAANILENKYRAYPVDETYNPSILTEIIDYSLGEVLAGYGISKQEIIEPKGQSRH